VLHRHKVDLDELVLITTTGVIVAVEAHAYRDPLVVHEVTNAGRHATWPLSWMDGYLVLGIMLPPSAPRLGGDPDDASGAVPVLVIDGDAVRVTFVLHDDLKPRVPS